LARRRRRVLVRLIPRENGIGLVGRRQFLIATGALLAAPRAAEAQPPKKVIRIGFMRVGSPPQTFIDGFRQGLRELGYVEGQDIVIEFGLAQTRAQVADVAAELVRHKVDVLLASGVPSVLPAKNATTKIPVVFVAAIDPVAAGIVASLGRPGGNVTGVTVMSAELTAKRIELSREFLPKLSRIAVLVRASSPAAAQYVAEAELAARKFGTSLQVLSVREPNELEGAISAARGASVLVWSDDAVLTARRDQIAELALKNGLPTVCGLPEVVAAGALMAYGPDTGQLYRRAATYVDRILKGAKPADLPVEQPDRFTLVINLGTAKALGLTIPQTFIAGADRVIE
jgi:putative ABC transport system substrate-binding protein